MQNRRYTLIFSRPVRQNALFFLCLYLFGAVCIVFEPWNGSRFLSLIELFFDTYLLCAVLTTIPPTARKWVKGIVAALLYLIGIVDMFCYEKLHTPITPSLFQIAVQTTWEESHEAIVFYQDSSLLLSPFGLLCLIILFHLTFSFGKRRLIQVPDWLKRLSAAAMPAVLCVCTIISIPNKEWMLYSQILELPYDKMEKYSLFESKTRLYLPVYRLADAYRQYRENRKAMRQLLTVAENAQIDSCCFRSPTIVLIIGESYNRHHSQLYGYSKATTPFQMKRMEQNQLSVFKDVVSSWNLTYLSFQDMFSLNTQNDKKNWYSYPFFTTLFKRAGYTVSFFSNQYVTHLSERYSDFLEDVFMNDPRMSKHQFDIRNSSLHTYDGDLLSDYDSLCKNRQDSHHLIIFHFLGLHADFALRFPPEGKIFKQEMYNRPDLSNDDKQIIADYDNAIRYNDDIIEKIIQRFEHQEAIIVFLADHGERVFDFGTQEYGRTFFFNKSNVAQQYHIPFWIWCSEEYTEKHPDICHRIEEATEKKWTTAHLAHLMLYLGGIESKYYVDSVNPLSQTFKEKNRIIGEDVDYDQLIGRTDASDIIFQ